MRSVGPTSMPWNDLYYGTRHHSPGILHTPIIVKAVFRKELYRLEKCNNRMYKYVDSSIVSCVCRVLRIYYRRRVKQKKIAIHVHNPSLFIVTLAIKIFCPKAIVIVNLHKNPLHRNNLPNLFHSILLQGLYCKFYFHRF